MYILKAKQIHIYIPIINHLHAHGKSKWKTNYAIITETIITVNASFYLIIYIYSR